MFLTAFVGIIVERVGYRPLREAPRASAAITGLMIGIILETSNILFLGGSRLKFPQLIESVTYNIGGVFVTNKKIMIVLVSIGLMLALHQFISRTRWGMAMRAMAYDYVVVPLGGRAHEHHCRHDLCHRFGAGRRRRHPFGLAYPVLDPYMGVSFGWKAFVAAILGGRGSIMGACIAGFMLGFIEIMTVPAIQIVNRLFSLNIGSNSA
jgi:branched-chain amino acid transport system permease protein